MYKNYFPINLKKIRLVWKAKGARQDGFAGYTRTMIQTYESYRVDPPIDLMLFLAERSGLSLHDLVTREILRTEIIDTPIGETQYEFEELEKRKKQRIEGLS